MISLTSKGDFSAVIQKLNKMKNMKFDNILNDCGRKGVEALRKATPKKTGKTADSWTYEIKSSGNTAEIQWKNTNIVNGVPIAIIIDVGHGTGTGGWVPGSHYIEPAMKPVVDGILKMVREEVSKL